MDELEQLRKEKARLVEQRERERAKEREEKEVKGLRKEVRLMKQPKYVRVIKGVTKDSFSGVGMIFKVGAKKASPFVRQGLSNLAENARREQQRYEKVPIRVKKKKRVVKKRIIKRRKKEESRFPFF